MALLSFLRLSSLCTVNMFIPITWLSIAQTVLATTNPISVTSAVVLGNQTSTNDPGTYRDGGWESQIGSLYFRFYADTEHCDTTNASNCQLSSFRPNTLALSTSNPLQVTDFTTPSPGVLCDPGVSGYRLHLTNIISLSATQGFALYNNISRDTSVDIDGEAVGSGVATITYSGSGSPSCSVTRQFWDESEPLWGSHGAIGHNLDGYIYLLGALSNGAPGGNYSDVYAALVAPGSQTTLYAYQYWNGSAYTFTRLTYPNYNGYSPAAVMQNTPQGSISYNNYYNCYVYLLPGPALSGKILATTAQVPSGPWSPTVTVYAGSNLFYAPVAQPHFDVSGKTLIFDMSIFNPIYLQTVKLTFAG